VSAGTTGASLSVSSGTGTSTTISFTGAGTYSITFTSSFGVSEPIDTQHTVSGTVIAVAPPSSIGIIIAANASANANVTATVVAPTTGLVSGDVLKVGQEIQGSGVVGGYNAAPRTFTQTRGLASTYRYWAVTYRSASVFSTVINSGATHIFAPYLATTASGSLSGDTTTTATSVTLTVSGVPAGHEFKINGGTTNSAAVSTPTVGTTYAFNLTVRRTQAGGGDPSGAFSATGTTHSVTRVAASDTTPNPFSFTDVSSNVAVSSPQTSNSITVGGINAATNVTISGGTYSKNSGGYTSNLTTAVLGDTFSVRHTASSSNSTAVNTTLTIGGVSDTFTSTTVAAASDSTPNAFNFNNPDATNIARTSTITSAPVTLTGMDIASTVTQLSSGFTATANGSAVTLNAAVPANATLTLSTTSSGSYATSVSGSIAVGGVSSGTWTVTTQADPGTGTGGGGVSTGDYGLEIRNASGVVVFSPSMRTTNFIASGTYTGLGAGVTTNPAIPSEGMTSAGEIAVLIDSPGQSTFVPDFTVIRGTDEFTIKNNSSVSVDVNWMTVRY
tara:strand:- start:426 stop:2099 length:1674 start_codon:yes stop_codon:yes gene_type:complete